MAVSLNFRTAIGGFHKEDVVHYIEYMNTKHHDQVNQLQSELEELRARIAELSAMPDLREQVAAQEEALTAQQQQIEELTAQRDAALAEVEELQAQRTEAAALALANLELDAYRRAEQAERNAKARAEQIYQQATGTLAQATTQVDNAALQYKQIAEAVGTQLVQLQQALDGSKNALLDAATTMYAIRPAEDVK